MTRPSRTSFRPPRLIGRWRGWHLLVRLALLCGGLCLLPVLLWRFIDPPLTGLMAARLWQGLWSDKPIRFLHDPVDLDEISPHLVVAVLAAEDQGFLEHHGFDWEAIQAAFRHNGIHRRKRGASTLSQQTAKNVFLWENRSWVRKGFEVPYTVAIELLWGKRRIVEAYLNCVEFGPGIYGAEAAARHYWRVSAARLSPHQAAMLAATLPAPRRNNPAARTGFFSRRTAHVAAQMPFQDRCRILSELDLGEAGRGQGRSAGGARPQAAAPPRMRQKPSFGEPGSAAASIPVQLPSSAAPAPAPPATGEPAP